MPPLSESQQVPLDPARAMYQVRIVIDGPEDAVLSTAVKVRANLRRLAKPAGVVLRLADETSHITRARPFANDS